MTGFRSRGSAPSYRRHKASGQAVVTLNGRDFYLGPHGSRASIDAYDALIGEWAANGRRLSEESLTINELIVLYLELAESYYRKDGAPTTQVDRIRAALRFVHVAYGRLEPAEFGPLKLTACREAMIAAGLSRKTCNAYVGEIRAMFKWGNACELLDVAVVQALASVAGLRTGRSEAHETRPVLPVPDDRVAALEPFLPPQTWAMVRLHDLSGMRPREVAILRTGDLDRDGPVWFYYPERHKSEHHGRRREIGLGPQAQAVLLPFLKADPDAYLFDPRDVDADRLAALRANRQSPVQPSQRNRRPATPRCWPPRTTCGRRRSRKRTGWSSSTRGSKSATGRVFDYRPGHELILPRRRRFGNLRAPWLV
jgi:integrase